MFAHCTCVLFLFITNSSSCSPQEQFREIVFNQSEDFRSTLFSFQNAHENEDYALW